METLAVLVHDRSEAEAALSLAAEAGVAVELVMPAGLVGPAFIQALETLLGRPITAWCDDRPGLALAALRVGLRRLVLELPATDDPAVLRAAEAAANRLGNLVGKHGAKLHAALPTPLYVIRPGDRRFTLRQVAATLG